MFPYWAMTVEYGKMDRIPAEFQGVVDFGSDEQFLGVWNAKRASPLPDGRTCAKSASAPCGDHRGILVLSTYRLRHFVSWTSEFRRGPRTGPDPDDLSIPLGTVEQVSIEKHPAMLEHLLVLRAQAPDPIEHTFIIDIREYLEPLYEKIAWAAETAGAHLVAYGSASGEGDRGAEREERPASPASSWIHFHSEDEP